MARWLVSCPAAEVATPLWTAVVGVCRSVSGDVLGRSDLVDSGGVEWAAATLRAALATERRWAEVEPVSFVLWNCTLCAEGTLHPLARGALTTRAGDSCGGDPLAIRLA